MNWRAWLNGRRVGNYQLTLREELLVCMCFIRTRSGAGIVGTALLSTGILIAGDYLTTDWGLAKMDGPDQALILGVLYMLVVMSPVLIASVLFAGRVERDANAALRRMGFPICIKCQYDLRGLDGDHRADRCPECGALFADMPPVGKRKHTSA
ncbi:MAG: hypothetical protein IT430_03505 [Phycisphaerales bacterium]|nr:hypothetical protein [Phycisphaerales bacterium]